MLLAPAVALAANNLQGILRVFGDLINAATPIVVALALLAFFWGLVTYIWGNKDEADGGKGRDLMIWGIIALFVMVSVWGLVNVIGSTFGVDQQITVTVPRVQI